MKINIFLFIFLSIPHLLYAQSEIEKATREVDAIGRKEAIEEALSKTPKRSPAIAPKKTKPEAGEQSFYIQRIYLMGVESFLAEDFSALIKEYEFRELTLTDLNNLAGEIEAEYLRQGVIAAVFIPAQEIKKQTITLQVVESKMGELEIQEHKYFNPERLYYYWKMPQGEVLRYDRMSEYLQMMDRNPDRDVKAALSAGEKPGTTDVFLATQTRFPLHFVSTFDREGSLFTGRSRLSLGMRHNNFLGLDDMFLSNYVFGNYFSGVYAYHALPINYHGTSLLYGYSHSNSSPKKEYTRYSYKSEATNTLLSLKQELYAQGKYLGEASLGFEAKDKTTRNNDGTYNRDRLRILSAGTNFTLRGPSSNTYLSLELSQGLTAFGASRKNNPLASRNAKSAFTKVNLGVQQSRILAYGLKTELKLKTQISSTKLTPQEEFGLGGINSVRGYPTDDYLADNALLANAELLIPSFFIPDNLRLPYAPESLREEVTAVAFGDYGWGERRGALPTEKKSVDFLGVGAALRVKLYNQALLRLEWGFPLADPSILEAGHSRFHFSVDFQDLFPEEFFRIAKVIEEGNIRQMAWRLVDAEFSRRESPLGKKLYLYLTLAEVSYQQGEFTEAKELYTKVSEIGRSLYAQAEEYVRSCVTRQKDLKKYRHLARINYKERRFTQAKELWQKIIDEGQPKPLVFNF